MKEIRKFVPKNYDLLPPWHAVEARGWRGWRVLWVPKVKQMVINDYDGYK